MIETKTVQTLISRFESTPAADLTVNDGGGEVESPAKRRRCNLIGERNNHPKLSN